MSDLPLRRNYAFGLNSCDSRLLIFDVRAGAEEKAVAHLRENNYGDDAIAFFVRRLGDTSKLNAKQVWSAIARAWLDTLARNQHIRDPSLSHPILPQEEGLEEFLEIGFLAAKQAS